jgi:hypothetical protein
METTRVHVESILEWVLAAAFIMVMLGAGSVIVREFRTVTAGTPVIAREAPSLVAVPSPAGVPPRSVSVPVLLLPDGSSVRVGEALSQIAGRLGRQAEVGTQSVERAPNGERLIRFYEHAGSRFVLVFEPFEPDAEPRVAAIYLQ